MDLGNGYTRKAIFMTNDKFKAETRGEIHHVSVSFSHTDDGHQIAASPFFSVLQKI